VEDVMQDRKLYSRGEARLVRPGAEKLGQERRALWDSINNFCRDTNGRANITTTQGTNPARLEILPGSSGIAQLLIDASERPGSGFSITFDCQETRVGGLPVQAPAHWRTAPTAFHQVDVYQIKIR
jgi:hypothetical protein